MFAKHVLISGGSIHPLMVPSELTEGTGLCNPSIFVDGEDILVNLRHVQYELFHSEFDQKYASWHGPLIYLHPDDDVTLRTFNYLLKLDENLNVGEYHKVDTSKLDKEPLWEFIGLEDARVVRWEGKLYLCGVRRDTTTTGEGRMELSEIEYTKDGVTEVARYRIEPPGDWSYCEKNWMPVIDKPFHFVKWSNPAEVVKVNLETLSSERVNDVTSYVEVPRDLRGSSDVIPFEDGYMAITHEVDFWHNEAGRKDAIYYHRFVIWDKDWNIKHITPEFKFMDAKIEFCCGLAEYKGEYIITFGYQDNTSYALRVPSKILKDFIYG